MVADIVKSVVDAISGLLSGIGSTIVSTFESIFIEKTVGSDGQVTKTISTFAIWGLVFLGVGFASTLLWTIFRKI